MKCPNCGVNMKRLPTAGSHEEYVCSGCGMTKFKKAIEIDPMKTEMSPAPSPDKPNQTLLSNDTQKASMDPEASNKLDRARRNTELRRAVNDISGKLNDLEIQFDRRVEELQMLIGKLTKSLDIQDDD